MTRLRLALIVGLSIAVVAYSGGATAWWSVLAGLLVAGLVWALTALLRNR